MGKKKKKNKWTLKKIISHVLIIGIFILATFVMDYYQTKWRTEKIENESFTTYGFIEKLKRTSEWSSSKHDRDVVYLYFIKNDSVIHLIDQISEGKIDEIGMKIGNCYELKVVKHDYDVFKVNYYILKDTVIDKNLYKTHIYGTERHRKFIE